MVDDAAILVEIGSWAVDRPRALEVLKRYQYEDPYRFVSPLARCAVLSGARELHFMRAWGGLEVWFDGRPVREQTLRDPFGALFSDGDAEGQRDRQLAIGLVTALRTEPRSVTLASGSGAARVVRSLRGTGAPSSPPRRDASDWTCVKIGWGAVDGMLLPVECFTRAQEDCRFPAIRIEVSGTAVPDRPIPSERRPVEAVEDGVRLQFARMRAGVRPGISLYTQGVKVCDIPWPEPPLEFEAHVENDRLTLNIGQSGVVQDAEFARTVAVLRRLVAERAARMSERPTAWRGLAALTSLATGAFAVYLYERLRLADGPDLYYLRLRLPLYMGAMACCSVLGAVLSSSAAWRRAGDRAVATFCGMAASAMAAMSFFLGTEFAAAWVFTLAALGLGAALALAWLRTPPEKD